MIWVNSENVRHLTTPFGGVKSSGIGRDGGDWSFEFYMETKNVAFATTEHRIPKLGEDLAIREEVLVTRRAIDQSDFEVPELAERMVARISEIEIQYVRLPMTELSRDG